MHKLDQVVSLVSQRLHMIYIYRSGVGGLSADAQGHICPPEKGYVRVEPPPQEARNHQTQADKARSYVNEVCIRQTLWHSFAGQSDAHPTPKPNSRNVDVHKAISYPPK